MIDSNRCLLQAAAIWKWPVVRRSSLYRKMWCPANLCRTGDLAKSDEQIMWGRGVPYNFKQIPVINTDIEVVGGRGKH